MARVSETFLNSYQAMQMDKLQKPIIFVVDMINGFVKEGALHDEAIHEMCIRDSRNFWKLSLMKNISVMEKS